MTVTNNHLLLLKMIEEIDGYAILFLDEEGNIETWNKGAKKIKGYSHDEIIGKNFEVFYTEADRKAGLPQLLLKEARLKGTVYNESWRVKKSGEAFWGAITLTALHNEKHQLVGYSKVTRDLTERMLRERMMKDHAHELEIKNKELEQFVYIASHDLQEPLLTITNFIDLLKTEYPLDAEETASMYFDFITRSAERMKGLITGLLDYSRIGNERTASVIDCNRLLAEVLQDLGSSIELSGAVIRSTNLPVITGYQTELRQLFQNLISNALKFRKPDVRPQITITAFKKDGFWKFAIGDNGIGMDAKFNDKIFLIFQRLHSRDSFDGHGIGLAHCKKIVEMHDGEISVESSPGEGSTFYFTIPIHSKQKNYDKI